MEKSITVKEFIEQLQTLDQDAEIFISPRKGWRPISDMKPIREIKTVFSIDNPPRESQFIR